MALPPIAVVPFTHPTGVDFESFDRGYSHIPELAERSIGVPRVSYQSSAATAMAWIDLFHRLVVTDLFFLSGRQTHETTGNVLAALLYWGSCAPSALINGAGGDIYAGIALVDALDAIGGSATCLIGLAMSTGVLIYGAGRRRYDLSLLASD